MAVANVMTALQVSIGRHIWTCKALILIALVWSSNGGCEW
jgi:hypothetical protein